MDHLLIWDPARSSPECHGQPPAHLLEVCGGFRSVDVRFEASIMCLTPKTTTTLVTPTIRSSMVTGGSTTSREQEEAAEADMEAEVEATTVARLGQVSLSTQL
jgi:hypothetical protein